MRKDKLRKASKKFKRTRLAKRVSSLMREESKTAKERKTYQSNMGVAGVVTTTENNKLNLLPERNAKKMCESP